METHGHELAGVRILIVEDEPLIAMDHAEWLAAAGATIIGPCAEVSEAIEALDRQDVDIAVVDFVLPDGNSAPLQEALERKGVLLVVVTAYPPVLVRRDDKQAIHTKPVTGDRLREAVVEALRTRLEKRA